MTSGCTGPPVEVQGGELLRRMLADVLHLQLDDLRLGGQVDEDETVGVWMFVDGEGTVDEPGDGDGVEPVNHPQVLEDGEVAALPGERGWDAGHGATPSPPATGRAAPRSRRRPWPGPPTCGSAKVTCVTFRL